MILGVQERKELLGQFDLCVIDPPYIDKKVWVKYFEAAACLLKPEGQVLMTSIPENEPMLRAEWSKLNRGTEIKSHPFVPINAECLHKFAVFTTFEAEALQKENDEPVPESQGLGQQSGGLREDREMDEIEEMFGGLQHCVISMHLDNNDSDHESEPDTEEEPSYEFCEKSRIVIRKKEHAAAY